MAQSLWLIYFNEEVRIMITYVIAIAAAVILLALNLIRDFGKKGWFFQSIIQQKRQGYPVFFAVRKSFSLFAVI